MANMNSKKLGQSQNEMTNRGLKTHNMNAANNH